MNTIELRNIIKSKIDNINDQKFLSAIFALIETKKGDVIILTEEQKKIIQTAQKEYLSGNHFDNDQVNEEIERWLLEK
jgi:hypothetical protein